MTELSNLEKARLQYLPAMPACLGADYPALGLIRGVATGAVSDGEKLKQLFPNIFGQPSLKLEKVAAGALSQKVLQVGVVLSGGQAPGGHNVIVGLFDGLKRLNPDNRLWGFLGGPGGLVADQAVEIDAVLVEKYRNTGGFDMIRSGRTKIEKKEQFEACREVFRRRNLQALVVIGGDDSNTNAAVLAEYFKSQGDPVQVIGAPKTIDGDLKNEEIETSFGFDTACRVYAELVGNICRDSKSAAKYWHFIKLMGRSASHITLEVALQTQVNLTLIGEEVAEKKMTLRQLVKEIADVVEKRSRAGKSYGVALVPEGLIEFIPEIGKLIASLNDLLAAHAGEFAACANLPAQSAWLGSHLSAELKVLFAGLPESIQKQLLADRDPHGNVQVSLIQTEQLLGELVAAEMKKRGVKFSFLHHFFGYCGRCAFPSNFDANYTYSLGRVAGALIAGGVTGYLACLKGLDKPARQWQPCGVPLTSMMNLERRHGADKPVIRKALVRLDARPFRHFAERRQSWADGDHYVYPGPIQYYGPAEICDIVTHTLKLERSEV